MIKSLKEAVEISEETTSNGEPIEYTCNFVLNISGNAYKVYGASICRGDILFYADSRCLNYMVDYYDGKGVAELFSIEE